MKEFEEAQKEVKKSIKIVKNMESDFSDKKLYKELITYFENRLNNNIRYAETLINNKEVKKAKEILKNNKKFQEEWLIALK